MAEDRNREIGNRLKAARKAAGFSSANDAAAALEISYPTYAAHENGTRGINHRALERYSKYFDVTIDWLISGGNDAVFNPHKRKIDEKLSFIMKATGWRQTDLAERLSVTQAAVSRWFAGADPRGEQRDKINEIYNEITGNAGVTGNTQIPSKSYVPLMGYIGAGAKIKPDIGQIPADGFGVIEVPFQMPADMMAFRVRGDGMLPVYQDGNVVFVYKYQRKPFEEFYGENAVVCTDSGERFIKTITRGAGGANLISWNAKVIENVKLKWIGEIFAVFPNLSILTKQS